MPCASRANLSEREVLVDQGSRRGINPLRPLCQPLVVVRMVSVLLEYPHTRLSSAVRLQHERERDLPLIVLEIPIHSARNTVTPMSVATGTTRSLTLPSSRVGKFRSASPGTGPWESSLSQPDTPLLLKKAPRHGRRVIHGLLRPL
jgi:hypothetical protein